MQDVIRHEELADKNMKRTKKLRMVQFPDLHNKFGMVMGVCNKQQWFFFLAVWDAEQTVVLS